MGERWLRFRDEAWIFNWTEGNGLQREILEAAAKHHVNRAETNPSASLGMHKGDTSLLECVLLSVFGTLVGLFLVFQLVLYVRFCITGHHDWKWSLPYLLRVRRVNCRGRADGEGREEGKGKKGTKGEDAEKGQWDVSGAPTGGGTVWAHVYPGEQGAPAVPCRRGFFFTTRSLSSYFRSIAASMSPNTAPGDPRPRGGNISPLPAAVFLVDPHDPSVQTAQSSSAKTLPASSSTASNWRPCNLISGRGSNLLRSGETSIIPSTPTGIGPSGGDVVMFHCENPGYESDASLAFTHTDDEGATTDPAEVMTRVGSDSLPNEVLSDDSFTSISSLSLTSLSRSRCHSIVTGRRNSSTRSAKSKTSLSNRKRLSSEAGESKRVRFKTSSRNNSNASETKAEACGKSSTTSSDDLDKETTAPKADNAKVSESTNNLNKTSEKGTPTPDVKRDFKKGNFAKDAVQPTPNIAVSMSNESSMKETNLEPGVHKETIGKIETIGNDKEVSESTSDGNYPDSNSS